MLLKPRTAHHKPETRHPCPLQRPASGNRFYKRTHDSQSADGEVTDSDSASNTKREPHQASAWPVSRRVGCGEGCSALLQEAAEEARRELLEVARLLEAEVRAH